MSFLSLGKVRSAAMNTLHGGWGGARPIAIDFGVGSLKLLQLADGDPPALVAAAAIDTPEPLISDHAKRFEFQFQALPRLLRGGGFKGKRAVCAIPAGQTFIKHMQFPRNDGVDLAELVQIGVPAALNCAPEALILRHFAVEGAAPGSGATRESSGPKQEVICMAAARDFVQRIIEAVLACNLQCVGIHPEAVATITAFEHINRRTADKGVATLYLDLACGTTKVWITHGSTLVFAKTIQIGGRDLDAAVARAMGLGSAAARTKRLAASVLVAPAARPVHSPAPDVSGAGLGLAAMAADGSPDPLGKSDPATLTADDRRSGRVAPGLTPRVGEQGAAPVAPPEFDLADTLDNLTDEIAMCLRYYEQMFPGRHVDRAIFFGGESRHRGLCQHIARKIGSGRLPAQVADPLARMSRTGREPVSGADFTTPQPGWTIPFGLCMSPTDL
jgi:type IV pilus assembly protein PilM